MPLSDYQSAILQHMGIPVFVAKSDDHADDTEQGVSQTNSQSQATPVNTTPLNKEEKQARLSALRQVMSSSPEESESSSQESSLQESSNKSTDTTAPSQKFSELSSSELSQTIVDDIVSAASACGEEFTNDQIVVGSELDITSTHLILPTTPSQLNAAQKRALWQALCEKFNAK